MPFLIFIGIDNKRGGTNSCKGYMVRRTSNKVVVNYGAIDAIMRKYYWAGPGLPMVTRYRCRDEKLARKLARRLIQEQLVDRRGGSYKRLGPGKRILNYQYSPKRRM